jgi:hypothetical protein
MVFENRMLRRIFGAKRDEEKIFQGSMNDAKIFDC